jgi:hypothetical protein
MDMSHSLNFLYGALSCFLPVPHCKARIGIGSFDRNIGGRLDDESNPAEVNLKGADRLRLLALALSLTQTRVRQEGELDLVGFLSLARVLTRTWNNRFDGLTMSSCRDRRRRPIIALSRSSTDILITNRTTSRSASKCVLGTT